LKFDTLRKIQESMKYDIENGVINNHQFRMVMLHDAALYQLRKEVQNCQGIKKARGLFKRMGFASGCYDATIALKHRGQLNDMELFEIGPKLHSMEGLVRVEPIRMEIDIEKKYLAGQFLWHNSYEADICLHNEGLNEHSVCWMQLGYAMGFCSTLVDNFIYFEETCCRGKGDNICVIDGRPVEEWPEEQVEHFFETDCISDPISWLYQRLDFTEPSQEVQKQQIIGESVALKQTLILVDKAAMTSSPVLLQGETGSGKELIAQRLHNQSTRQEQPFVAVNCAALPPELIESELFGVVKGAFTGAYETRAGRFERAHGGTLFLDEIGDLSISAQAKLLRALQEGEIERVGDSKTISVDVRVIAATHVDLPKAIEEKRFRADLFYRLNVIAITIPSLRDRLEDIEHLSKYFLEKYSVSYRKHNLKLGSDCLSLLKQYSWPGNIRELQNTIERLVIFSEEGIIGRDELNKVTNPHQATIGLKSDIDLCQTTIDDMIDSELGLDEIMNEVIKQSLKKNQANISKTARALQVNRRVLDYRIKKFNIPLKDS